MNIEIGYTVIITQRINGIEFATKNLVSGEIEAWVVVDAMGLCHFSYSNPL